MADKDPIEEEGQRVLEALDAVEAMTDHLVRARVISRLLKDQTDRNKRLKDQRRQVVLELRSQKVSYRKIASALGVSLATVQDIESGYSGSGRDRPRKRAQPEE